MNVYDAAAMFCGVSSFWRGLHENDIGMWATGSAFCVYVIMSICERKGCP